MFRKALILVFVVAGMLAAVSRADAAVKVASMSGKVEVRADDGAAWKPAAAGAMLARGASIRTGVGATCMLRWSNGHAAKVQPLTVLALSKVESGEDGLNEIGLGTGKVVVHVKKASRGVSNFSVKTPTAIAGVRGTDFFVDVKGGGETEVGVFEGTVFASAGGREFDVAENFYIEIGPSGDIAPPEVMPEPMRQENIEDVKDVREEAAAAGNAPDDSRRDDKDAKEEKDDKDVKAENGDAKGGDATEPGAEEAAPAVDSAVDTALESVEGVVENQIENIESVQDAQVIEGTIHVDVYLNQ